MINFLHNNIPDRLLISFGQISIYWYGLFVVIGILLAIIISLILANYYQVSKDKIVDLSFWLIIGGIIGARIYHVILEWTYYYENPINIFKVWQGGLAIHGAIFAGLLIILYWAKKNKQNFWLITSILMPGLSLALALGRWGNYFNQENYGLPTNLSWGIPILPENRMIEYFNNIYFHPTFLYESIGDLLIFLILISLHVLVVKKHIKNYQLPALIFLILYSILRFFIEFIRIDITPVTFGLRWPQIMSIIIIVFSILILLLPKIKKD